VRIACIGGGPAALYASVLIKRRRPETEIVVHERNRPDDTFGWGVVFSDETLGHIETADPPTYAAMSKAFVRWDAIDTHVGGAKVRSTGHGFCGLSRRRLLLLLHERCRELGVTLRFEHEVPDPRALQRDADLVVGADGVQSRVREVFAEHFRPDVRLGDARFTWLGTTLPLEAFTFVFREDAHGLWTVHSYPFEKGLSTFIVECSEATWRSAGMDRADEAATAAHVERLFADHLHGHRVLTNKSIWRRFPTVKNARWHHENVVLLGDAAHTAHFSIGSGTKLAMEDAIALDHALARHGEHDLAAALAAYQDARTKDVQRLQRAARVSQAWFEDAARYVRQDPDTFVFNLMTRSQRLTWANLETRDPALVARVAARWEPPGSRAPAVPSAPTRAFPPLLAPFRLRGVALPNRVVVSPMCQYSAVDGVPQEWHLVHLGSRAVGGAGLVLAEMTHVAPEGRITTGCTGLWNDAQEAAWRRIVEFVHRESASKIGIQLAHAGRKASCSLPWEGDRPLVGAAAWTTLGPSALPYGPGWPAPKAMDRADLERVRIAFVEAARRAARAGFDVLELHAAHGYLLSSFLTPVANRRDDEYGGDLVGRMRWPLEVVTAVRAAWPSEKPLFVRLTGSDWLEGAEGMTPADAVVVARALKGAGCDLVDVSSGGNTPASAIEYGRMYQVPFADRIRHEADVPVMAVGGIPDADHANTVLAAGRADLVAIARGHLLDPHLTLRSAHAARSTSFAWPKQYRPARGF
jgi:anthraniloyl-CoA monooxygenase